MPTPSEVSTPQEAVGMTDPNSPWHTNSLLL